MSLFDNPNKQYIRDLKVGQKIESCFRLTTMEKRSKKDGGAYLTLELMDKTGRIPAKIWDDAEALAKILTPGDIYRLHAVVGEYNGKKELKVENIKAAANDRDCDPNDFMEKAAFDTDALFHDFIDTVKTNISNPFLSQLTDLFAERYGERFKNHYGAQKIHHAYLGGLLQHSHSMAKVALQIAAHYNLDKELLLMGVLFHDSGKLFEFSIYPAPESTMEGGLIGHIVISNNIFLELKNRVSGFPRELSIKIQHLIISHHGEKEFGSPEVPRFPEAFALHIIDLLDSKIKIMEEAIQSTETPGVFTDYIQTLGRRLYIGPKTKSTDSQG